MIQPSVPTGFESFLVRAKRRTYAGSDDDTTIERPRLEGSMQLDWSEQDWLYRDVYFGMSAFTGIETVYHTGKPLWAMAYSGGVARGNDKAKTIYAFLRAALRAMPDSFPVRGPIQFEAGGFSYQMTASGDLCSFQGSERIVVDGREEYALVFCGGLIV